MRKKVYLVLVPSVFIVILSVAGFIFYKVYNERILRQKSEQSAEMKAKESSDSAFGGLVNSVPNSTATQSSESLYKFNPDYKYNINQEIKGTLKGISNETGITIENNGIIQYYAYYVDDGFVLFCYLDTFTSTDGSTHRSSETSVDYSRMTDSDRDLFIRGSKNLTVDEKVKFLSDKGIGKKVAMGINKEDTEVVDSIYLFVDDESICE